ncbi:hypothetical protein BUE80_DR001388, partial [Diplocarpon rosae]
MKYFVLTLALSALASAELYCNAGVTQPTRSCCINWDKPTQVWDNPRKGCGGPEGGEKLSCGSINEVVAVS